MNEPVIQSETEICRQNFILKKCCTTGFRFAPVISTVDEEVESQHLRFLAVPPGRTVFDILI